MNSLFKFALFMLDFHFHFYLIPFLEEMVSNLKFYRNGFIPQNFYHRPTRIRRRCNLTWKFSHCFISRKCFWRDELIVSKRLRVERVHFELGKFLYQKEGILPNINQKKKKLEFTKVLYFTKYQAQTVGHHLSPKAT